MTFFPDDNYSAFVKDCRGCTLCRKKCRFLQTYGSPGHIRNEHYNHPEKWHRAAFECSLCHLCTAVCPRGFNPPRMFLEFRRQAVAEGLADLSPYRPLLKYEKTGSSKAFRLNHFPKNCRTVFFPGCALSGTRPGLVVSTTAWLQRHIPNLGIVLDCCLKPSHDLGRQAFFDTRFRALMARLRHGRVSRVIVACPSCLDIFSSHAPEIDVITVYEVIAEAGSQPAKNRWTGISAHGVCIHDACQTRFDEPVHQAVRKITADCGLEINELPDNREKTFCCGEGAGVGLACPDMAGSWTDKRLADIGNRKAVCYCAGCVGILSRKADTVHVLDLFFDPEQALAGKCRNYRSPITYFNRLILKYRLAEMMAENI